MGVAKATCYRRHQRLLGDGLHEQRAVRRPFVPDSDPCRLPQPQVSRGRPKNQRRAFQVVEILDRTARERRKPKTIRCDNDPEFSGRILDQWAQLNGVEIDFSRLRKATDNAFFEDFNARLRAECRNASWFLSYLVPALESKNGGANTTKIDRTPLWET